MPSRTATAVFSSESPVPGDVQPLPLTLYQRRRLRQVVPLPSGGEVGIALERGSALTPGAYLRCDDGSILRIEAAPESLSQAQSADPLTLTRVAYHLGNRHIPVEIQAGQLRYQHDHVLDDMVRGLGVAVASVQAAFQPEAGAYGRGGHSHDHDHHDHDHPHDGHSHS